MSRAARGGAAPVALTNVQMKYDQERPRDAIGPEGAESVDSSGPGGVCGVATQTLGSGVMARVLSVAAGRGLSRHEPAVQKRDFRFPPKVQQVQARNCQPPNTKRERNFRTD